MFWRQSLTGQMCNKNTADNEFFENSFRKWLLWNMERNNQTFFLSLFSRFICFSFVYYCTVASLSSPLFFLPPGRSSFIPFLFSFPLPPSSWLTFPVPISHSPLSPLLLCISLIHSLRLFYLFSVAFAIFEVNHCFIWIPKSKCCRGSLTHTTVLHAGHFTHFYAFVVVVWYPEQKKIISLITKLFLFSFVCFPTTEQELKLTMFWPWI